jgi:hypothetical protein
LREELALEPDLPSVFWPGLFSAFELAVEADVDDVGFMVKRFLRIFPTVPPIDWTLFGATANYLFYLRAAFLAVEFRKFAFSHWQKCFKGAS